MHSGALQEERVADFEAASTAAESKTSGKGRAKSKSQAQSRNDAIHVLDMLIIVGPCSPT